MTLEIINFLIYSLTIVIISKLILAPTIRKLAEELKLKAQTIGAISGYVTSIPELLTIVASSATGLLAAGIFNVISSNVINLVQYIFAVIRNKNIKYLNNKAIFINLLLVIVTIFIPAIIIKFEIDIDMKMVIIFILLYILFRIASNKSHSLYLKKEDKQIAKNIKHEEKISKKSREKARIYVLTLIAMGLCLFAVGEKLSVTIENLCTIFDVPEFIIGVLLGFITSIPELMTFFESQKHYEENKMLGVVEATNNLLTSNMVNLFIIESFAIIVFMLLF